MNKRKRNVIFSVGLISLLLVNILSLTLFLILNISGSPLIIEEEGDELYFERVNKGPLSGQISQKNYVINSQWWFEYLWNLTYSIYDHLPMMPTIDFTTHTVIATYLGEKDITGYEITITQIIEYSTHIKTFIEITEPVFMNDPGPVQPYHMVKLEKISKPVTFHFISTTTPENNDYVPENRESELVIIFSLVGGNFGLLLLTIFYVIRKEIMRNRLIKESSNYLNKTENPR